MKRAAAGGLIDAAVLGPLRHTPGRTLLAAFAIALGVALGFAIHLINRVAADEMSLAARSMFGVADMAVEASGRGFDETLYPVIARLPGIAVASPVVEAEAKLVGRRGSLTVLGMDAYKSRRLQPAFASLGETASRRDSDSQLPALFLSSSAARSLSLAGGDELEMQVGMRRERFVVAAVLPSEALHERAAVLDISTAQWKFERLGTLSRINLRLAAGSNPQQVRASLTRVIPTHARIVDPGAATNDALRLSRAYRSNLTALALVALFTGGFFVYSTQSLAVLRRRREFALLHALGVTRGEQLALALAGGALIGIMGSLLGLLLGAAIADAGIGLLGGDLGAGLFPGVAPQLQVRLVEAVVFCALGAAVALAGTLRPALDAARTPTATALKAGDVESGLIAPQRAWLRGLFVALLFVLAVGALFAPPVAGLPLPGYVSIALLIVGTVAAMPSILLALLRLLARGGLDTAAGPRAVPFQIAIAHLRGTARYATLSVSAIVVSFSLMIAMAIMVNSFRHSLDLWTQKILPADLYLRSGYGRQSAHLDASAVDGLREIRGIATVRVSRFAEVDVPAGGGYETITLVARDIDTDSAGNTLWMEKVAAGRAPPGTVPVWISEAAADLFSLQPGSTAQLLLAGKPVQVSVRGIWRDYEHQRGAIVMNRDAYVRLTGDAFINGVWIWLAPGADEGIVQQAIRARLPADAEFDMRTPRDIRKLSLQAFDRTFAVTYALELIAILIGLFGISAGTSAQVLARRGEFGVLRHVGLTRAQIAATLAMEGVALGTLGVLAGLAAGAAVSLILIYVVNRQSFHWSMDVFVPAGLVMGLSLALIASAALIAVFSGRQAMRGDVVRAVKEDW